MQNTTNRKRMQATVSLLGLGLLMLMGPVAAQGKLDGTKWRLVEVVSANGKESALIDIPDKYTIAFQRNSAILTLDCNLANANWVSDAKPGAEVGSLTFSGLSSSQPQCPHPTMNQQILNDLPKIRSFATKGYELRMVLDKAGGTYIWGKAAQ